METVEQLERKLAEAKRRKKLDAERCSGCRGDGWFDDTTYDRGGVLVKCNTCRGTGLPKPKVEVLIADALAPYVKPRPT